MDTYGQGHGLVSGIPFQKKSSLPRAVPVCLSARTRENSKRSFSDGKLWFIKSGGAIETCDIWDAIHMAVRCLAVRLPAHSEGILPSL